MIHVLDSVMCSEQEHAWSQTFSPSVTITVVWSFSLTAFTHSQFISTSVR